MGTQERGDAAVVKCPGRRRGGGNHSQWAATWERGEVAAVIHSGWAQGSEAWLLMGEREEGRHETK